MEKWDQQTRLLLEHVHIKVHTDDVLYNATLTATTSNTEALFIICT